MGPGEIVKFARRKLPAFKLLRTLLFRIYGDPCSDYDIFPHVVFFGSVCSLQAKVWTNTNLYGLLTIGHAVTLTSALCRQGETNVNNSGNHPDFVVGGRIAQLALQ
jgi:hypothetical protein